MASVIDLYLTNYKLKRAFGSASGDISRKDEFIVALRDEGGRLKYAMEFPLSPSSGEMPIDVIKLSLSNQFHKSRTAKVFFSYARARLPPAFCFSSDFARYCLSVRTFGIGAFDDVNICHHDLVRLKASDQNLAEVVSAIKRFPGRVWVDFNASLNIESFISFISQVPPEEIYAVEQPLSYSEVVPSLPCLLIADETYQKFGADVCARLGYTGYIFKPFMNTFDKYLYCIRNMPGWAVVGSNVSGPLDCCLTNLLGELMPVVTPARSASHLYNHPLESCINDLYTLSCGHITPTERLEHYLQTQAERCYSFRLP